MKQWPCRLCRLLTIAGCLWLQADMLTQEAAYKQIQDAKNMVEDDLQHRLDEFEEERERLLKLANTASTLERELEQVNVDWCFFV